MAAMQLSTNEIANLRLILKRISFLEHLKVNELDALIGVLDKRPFRREEVLIKQGTPGETFYIMASGKAGVYKEKFWSKKRFAELAENQFFGEMALLTDIKRTASVIAETDGEIYFLPRDAFKKILMMNPGIGEMIRTTASYREAKNKALHLE